MFSNLKVLILILVMMLTLSGCGDLLGKKVVKRDLGSSIASVSCELDIDKFADIMKHDISSQIRCLGEQLHMFIRIVKSGKPGHLSRIQLERYLTDIRTDTPPEVIKALGSIFSLGHLITGEDPNYISKQTVDKVISFALEFNLQAALHFGPIFQKSEPVSWELHQDHRRRVKNASMAILAKLRPIFNSNRNGAIHQLSIIELLDSFSTDNNRHHIEKIKKVIFLKKVLYGGDREIITHVEFEKAIHNFEKIIFIALDIYRYKYIILDQAEILEILKQGVDELHRIIHKNDRDEEVLFSVDHAIEAAKMFIEEGGFDVEKYRNLIGEAKVIAVSGSKTEVKGSELKIFFNHANSLLEKGTFFYRIYERFKTQLDSPLPVNIDFSEYRHTYPTNQKELDQFERIVKKYRFMKGEFLSAYYTHGYKRNPDAVFEIALLEYVIQLVFVKYGVPSPNADAVGGVSIDDELMQKLVKKFEKELIDLNLLTPRKADSTADNVSLLGTLFQFQSDKNGVLDVNEMTEFGLSLFTSLNISDDLYSFIDKQKCSKDEFDRFEPACFRSNFWQGMCKDYRIYYPLMFESLNAPAKCEDWINTSASDALLDRAIEAARTCNRYPDDQSEIPYAKGDIMTIMLALIHAETTILRWDTNKNNYMDANEVMKAYEIYSPALDGFLKDKSPIIKRFKKQIFQYMIKYEKVPDEKDFKSIWQFVRFLVRVNKNAPATRKTIVSILGAIAEQNSQMQTGPGFDCRWMRDPNNIPSGPVDKVFQAPDTRQDLSSILLPYAHLAD